MKKPLLLTLTLLSSLVLNAQTYYKYLNEPTISSSSFASCVATSTGYIFAGSANNLLFDSHFLVSRISSAGAVQQIRTFPNPGFNNINSVIETIDGKIAFWGTEGNSATFVNSLALVKTDIVGNFLINKTYSSPNHSLTATKFMQDAQGNYYLLATASNTQTFQDEICVLKTDASGNLISQKFISLGVSTSSMDIIATSGNGILVTGYANNGSSIETIALFKLDASLSLVWNKWYGNSTNKYFHYDIKLKPNGNFILCGRYDDTVNPYSTLIMELDGNGNQTWAKNYPAIDNSRVHGYALQINSAGDVIVAGGIDRGLGTGPVMAMSVNGANGSVNWSKFLNSGALAENVYDMVFTSSGEILACGYRDQNASVIKASATFDLCSDSLYGISESSLTVPTQAASATISNAALSSGTWSHTPTTFTTMTDGCTNVGISEAENTLTFNMYPNPVSNEFYIETKDPLAEIKIYDQAGRLVQQVRSNNETKLKINTSTFRKGLYEIQMFSGDQYGRARIVKVE